MLTDRCLAENTPEFWTTLYYADKNIKTERLTSDRVLAAFQKTGKKPEQRIYAKKDCLCGVAAVYESEVCAVDNRTKEQFLYVELRLNFSYFSGFMIGWDGYKKYEDAARRAPTWSDGYDDGRAAWEACRHLAFLNTHSTPPKEVEVNQ